MKKTVCFGELMLRLSPEGYGRFVQADRFEATYGGGEANVAVSLANFGTPAAFVSRIPENPIGQAAVNSLRRYGVEVSGITRGGDRLGIYYLEKGASQRPSKVVYDRKYSAIATATPADFDWPALFEGADWFHVTGITPALSPETAAITLQAAKTAKETGLTVSCDLNFRKNLWTREQAGKTMGELMQFVDLVIANEEDADCVFGIRAADSDVTGGKLSREGYKEVARQLCGRFGCRAAAITLRQSISASDNVWGAMLYDGEQFCFSKEYPVHIVDRVGGGDSFGAGLIYAMKSGYSTRDAVEFATAASCLKHSIEGDYNQVTVAEVKALAGGDGSGRVQR